MSLKNVSAEWTNSLFLRLKLKVDAERLREYSHVLGARQRLGISNYPCWYRDHARGERYELVPSLFRQSELCTAKSVTFFAEFVAHDYTGNRSSRKNLQRAEPGDPERANFGPGPSPFDAGAQSHGRQLP